MNAPPFEIGRIVADNAVARSNAPAVEEIDGRTISWRAFGSMVDQIACQLRREGVGSGSAVAIVLPTTVEHIAAMVAIMSLGATAVPISLLLRAETVARMIEDAGAQVVISDPALGLVVPQDGLSCLSLEPAEGWLKLEFSNTSGRAALEPGARDFDTATPGSIIYSSGTTGMPKGIVHSHMARALYGAVFAQEYGVRQNSRVLLSTAAYSNASWMMILSSLYAGACLVIVTNLDMSQFVDICSSRRVTHCFLVPTQIHDLLAGVNTAAQGARDTALECIVSAGSYLPADQKRAMVETFGPILFELFGNTEGCGTLLRPWEMREGKFDTVGTPITTTRLRVLRPDGSLAKTGEAGEVVGGSPLQSLGYHNNPSANAALFWRDYDGTMLVRTGDIGRLDDDGFLTINGRMKDMIVSGGLNVFAVDIEDILREHPNVYDAAVVARSDNRWGERPYAFVIPTAGKTIAAEKIVAWANDRLAKHQRICGLSFVATFPRNALGKVVKPDLLQRLLNAEVCVPSTD